MRSAEKSHGQSPANSAGERLKASQIFTPTSPKTGQAIGLELKSLGFLWSLDAWTLGAFVTDAE